MDVKWIKLMVDMFDNRKIRYLRRLPEGNSIVLIWVMLLSLAGRCNAGGMIHLTRDIPYTTKMLADELDFEENTVVLALKALEGLSMISQDPLSVTNWEEYQCTEKLDKIREQTKKRMADYRARQKAIADETQGNADETRNVTRNVTQDVTQGYATDIDIEEDIDRDKEKEEDKDLSISERERERKSKVVDTNTARAGETDPALSVFRSFLERKWKELHPVERGARREWSIRLMEAMTCYVADKAKAETPLTVKEAESICSMLETVIPMDSWITVFDITKGEET